MKTTALLALLCDLAQSTLLLTPRCTLKEEKSSVTLNCSHGNLTDIPQDLPRNTTDIILSHNRITLVKDYIFSDFPRLHAIRLDNNEIQFLEPLTFHGLPELRVLSLNNNNLKLSYASFPEDVFCGLPKLQEMDISENDITDITGYPDRIFACMSSLRSMRIDTFSNSTFGSGFRSLTNLRQLYLDGSHCIIERLENLTFKNFELIPVQRLNMSFCRRLSYIDPLAFQFFHNLTSVSFRGVRTIPLRDMIKALAVFKGKAMKNIDLFGIYRPSSFTGDVTNRVLTKDVLDPLMDVCVRDLNIGSNCQMYADSSAFTNRSISNCIESLDASHNDFLGGNGFFLMVQYFKKLKFLDISSLPSARHPNLFKSGTHIYDYIQVKDLKSTIHTETMIIYLPKTLTHVNLRAAADFVDLLSSTILRFENGLKILSVDMSHVRLRNIRHSVYGLDNLRSLDLSGNDLHNINPDFFSSFPLLTNLSLTHANLGSCTHFKVLFSKLHHLQRIHLAKNNLRRFPFNVFSNMSNLRAVTLTDNQFDAIPIALHPKLALTELDLFNNLLTNILSEQRNILDEISVHHSISLILGGNGLSCGCQTLDFIQWLGNTQVKLDNGGSYHCVGEDGVLTGTYHILKYYQLIWRRCVGRLCLLCIIIMLIIALLILTTAWVYKKHRAGIQHALLNLMTGGTWPERKNFPYDVHVGYCEAHYKFACLGLRKGLERNGLKVFLRDRDSHPGVSFADEIVRGIESSWTALLLLTSGWACDDWMSFTIERSIYESKLMPGRLVVVLVGEVDVEDLPPSLEDHVREDHVFSCQDYPDVLRILKDIADLVKD